MGKRGYKEKSYVKFVIVMAAAISVYRRRKTADAPLVGKIQKLNCF